MGWYWCFVRVARVIAVCVVLFGLAALALTTTVLVKKWIGMGVTHCVNVETSHRKVRGLMQLATASLMMTSHLGERQMNVERMRAVMARIEAEPEHFNMAWYFAKPGLDPCSFTPLVPVSAINVLDRTFNCGTVCCFAGFAVAMYGDATDLGSVRSTHDTAARLLGLSQDQANYLFTFSPPGESMLNVTPARLREEVELMITVYTSDAHSAAR